MSWPFPWHPAGCQPTVYPPTPGQAITPSVSLQGALWFQTALLLTQMWRLSLEYTFLLDWGMAVGLLWHQGNVKFLTEEVKDSLWLTRFFFSARETTDPPPDSATVCLGPEWSEEQSPWWKHSLWEINCRFKPVPAGKVFALQHSLAYPYHPSLPWKSWFPVQAP